MCGILGDFLLIFHYNDVIMGEKLFPFDDVIMQSAAYTDVVVAELYELSYYSGPWCNTSRQFTFQNIHNMCDCIKHIWFLYLYNHLQGHIIDAINKVVMVARILKKWKTKFRHSLTFLSKIMDEIKIKSTKPHNDLPVISITAIKYVWILEWSTNGVNFAMV